MKINILSYLLNFYSPPSPMCLSYFGSYKILIKFLIWGVLFISYGFFNFVDFWWRIRALPITNFQSSHHFPHGIFINCQIFFPFYFLSFLLLQYLVWIQTFLPPIFLSFFTTQISPKFLLGPFPFLFLSFFSLSRLEYSYPPNSLSNFV